MSRKLRPAVKALVEREGEILVLKAETENSTYWILPGGKVEYGESPVEALEREVMEELSTEAEIGQPVGMYHFFSGEDESGDQVVLTAFEADINIDEIDISNNPADENITQYEWLKPEELIEKSSNENLKDLITNYYNV